MTQFAELLKLDKKSSIKEIEIITKRLLSRVLKVETPNGWEMYQWVSYAKANFEKDLLVLRFHDELQPYLLNLKERFTSLKLSEVVNLKSVYSIRIYQLLKDFHGRRQMSFVYDVDDFKAIILGDGSKKYPLFKYFRSRTLNVAQAELNEKATLSFTFETIRTGRKIGRLKFTIIKINRAVNEETTSNVPNTQQEATLPIILSEYELFGVMRQTTTPFYKQRGEQALTNTLEYFKNEKKTKNIQSDGAYLITLLKANAGQEAEKAQGSSPQIPIIPNMRDGSQLQAWAIANGLPEAPAGFDTYQYRQMLQNKVEKMRNAQEREANRKQ